MAKINWPVLGRVACVIGAVMSIGAIVDMGLKAANQPKAICPAGAKAPTDAKAIVFAPTNQVLTVNGSVCIAIRTKAYFGTAAVQAAPAASSLASEAAATPPADAAEQAVQPAAAGEPTDDAQATEELAIFIDDQKAPATFAVPRASSTEWTWHLVKLPARNDAADDDAKGWRKILAGPADHGLRSVAIGIGGAKANAPRASAGEATLRIYQPYRVWLIGLGLVLVLGGAIMWGWQTGMLRDRAPSDAELNPPFSLGRSQMAFWFLLTLAGYLYIWLVTGQSLNVFNEGALVLLGVSGATGLAAMMVGDGDGDPPPVGKSKGYWTDILSDGGSIVVHRLQMLAWTVVLGLLFVWSVMSAYEFPDFGTTLLLLSGISGATYVGFKTREPTPAAEAEEPPVEAAGPGQDTQGGPA